MQLFAIFTSILTACFLWDHVHGKQCYDKANQTLLEKGLRKRCNFVASRTRFCARAHVREHCPVTCDSCSECIDIKGKHKLPNGNAKTCNFVNKRKGKFCGDYAVRKNCPVTCNACLDGCVDFPRSFRFKSLEVKCADATANPKWCTRSSKFGRRCKKSCNFCMVVNPNPPTLSPVTDPKTSSPVVSPSQPTRSPIDAAPTKAPSTSPVASSGNPTKAPTKTQTKSPTKTPTKSPTKAPTISSTKSPTKAPTKAPIPVQSFAYGSDDIVL